MSGHRSFHVLEALEASPERTRRVWSRAAKDGILAEASASGANVSAVARAHGVNVAQLFRWRRDAGSPGHPRAAVADVRTKEHSLSFVEMAPMPISEVAARSSAEICEIEVAGIVLRIGSSVSTQRVAELIRAARLA